MIHIQKRQLNKDTRVLRKILMEKAAQGELSLSEKEKYEELIEYARKSKIIRNQRIIACLGVLGLALTMLFFKYGTPRILNMAIPHEQVTYYEVPRLSNKSAKVLTQKIVAHIQRNNDVNAIYNEAIKQYDKESYIDAKYISEIEELIAFSTDTSLTDLGTLFKDISNKKIQILTELNKDNKDIHYIKSMIEEIRILSNTYRESIICILKNENIKCECTPNGIRICE